MAQPFFKRILLSEDIARSLQSLDCFLNRSEFQVLVGRSAEEIVDVGNRESPDVVMINYYLSGFKGDEACRQLKGADGATAAPPVVIAGPADPPDLESRCLEAGCNAYIVSPSGPNVLLQQLAVFLGIQFRLHTRIPAVISISFGRIVSEFLGYSKDISAGGILVETNLDLPLDRVLHLRLFLDERERPIVTRASVQRVERAPEEDQYLLGLKFQKLDPRATTRLQEFIRSRSEH
jgi:DNA-binding response OmpR family regulator